MTIRQAKRTILESVQDSIKVALADIGKEHGLKIYARPTVVGARKAQLQVTLTAAPATATATATAAAETAVNGTRSPQRPADVADREIELLVEQNPYRHGTKAYATFELMRRSKTVGDFHAAVAKSRSNRYVGYYLNWAMRPHGNQPAFVRLK
jgi:hypothetical protein